jgi:hypothetical protein
MQRKSESNHIIISGWRFFIVSLASNEHRQKQLLLESFLFYGDGIQGTNKIDEWVDIFIYDDVDSEKYIFVRGAVCNGAL